MTEYTQLLAQMTQAYQNHNRHLPDDASDIGIRMKVLAAQLAELCQQTQETHRQAFPLTSTGEALERHAAARGLTRKPGAMATGNLIFARPNPAGYDILIPKGTLCQTEGAEPLEFCTTQDTLLEGIYTYTVVPTQAVKMGAAGNVVARSITMMVTPPPGVVNLLQSADFRGGADPETDEALRERIQNSYRCANTGLSAGYYLQLALGTPGVRTAAVLPTERGSGTVDMVVYGSGAAVTPEVLAQLQQAADTGRALGIDPLVRSAQTTPVNLGVSIGVAQGWDYPQVSTLCEEKIRALMAELKIGEPFLLSRLTAVLMGCSGVKNCKISLPAQDVIPLADRVLVAEGITLSQMAGG